ncbi:FUSC family protein [Actinomycetospora termitidis]|uniref:FUSC family protein n=1 Tax=Actinomycetospora termitidis TaxID=3053470 RepID=A0ABT7MDB8_9PSEU|nr:FUSC family protein [Actinomycetospora sp. Odt1-22]MDL5158660.1 FUSC family protein [Actinomycetospora sp. Odt1-22]
MTIQATGHRAGIGPDDPDEPGSPAAVPARRDPGAVADRVGPPTRIRLRDRLLASDPGNVRIALATRAAVTLAVALGCSALLARLLGLAGTPAVVVIVLGAVLTMITTFTASDPTPAGRAVTQLCLPVAMLVGLTLSTLVDRHRVLSLLVFVLVMFAAVWVRRFGPRAFACGMVAWMGYFIALFLQLSFAQLPVVLASVGTTTVLLLVIALVVAPQRPARRLRRMVGSFAARTRIALAEHRDPARRPPWRRGDDTAHDRAVLRVNETAVLVDGQLAVPGVLADPHRAGEVRAAVLRAEAALARALDGAGDDVTAAEVERTLADLEAVLDDDRRGRPRRGAADGEPPPFAPAAELFAGFLPGSAATVGPMVAPPDGDGGGRTDRARRPLEGMLLSTRQALQITLAGGLSIALGDAVSGQRWYWAVLACFLAFTGTATAAETVRKAVQRTVGTVVGVVVALVVVPLLGHSTTVALTVILVAIFVGFYLFRVSYTSLAFAVTLVVAELYELLGTYSSGLLALRVGETALGALVGGIVAVSFLPTTAVRAEHAARARLAEELRAATADVAALVHATGERPDLHARARALDAAVHQLALIGVPLSLRIAPGGARRRPLLARRLAAWVRCAVRVRALVDAAAEYERTRRSVPGLRHERVGAATRAVQGLVDALAAGHGPGEHRHRRWEESPDDLLTELSALHGALVALHEIDPTATPAGPSTPTAPAGGTGVHGRVTDDAGRGLAAVVTVVDANGVQRGRVRSGEDGRFAVGTLPDGRSWQLVVAAAGHAPHAGRVVGAGAHEVVLRPTGPARR